jgi:replicative DNA helicase
MAKVDQHSENNLVKIMRSDEGEGVSIVNCTFNGLNNVVNSNVNADIVIVSNKFYT